MNLKKWNKNEIKFIIFWCNSLYLSVFILCLLCPLSLLLYVVEDEYDEDETLIIMSYVSCLMSQRRLRRRRLLRRQVNPICISHPKYSLSPRNYKTINPFLILILILNDISSWYELIFCSIFPLFLLLLSINHNQTTLKKKRIQSRGISKANMAMSSFLIFIFSGFSFIIKLSPYKYTHTWWTHEHIWTRRHTLFFWCVYAMRLRIVNCMMNLMIDDFWLVECNRDDEY